MRESLFLIFRYGPDIRKSKVVDVVREVQKNGAGVDMYDPWAVGYVAGLSGSGRYLPNHRRSCRPNL